jgi:hypothetical protein
MGGMAESLERGWGMQTKRCAKCEEEKDQSEFWLCACNEDGLESVCIKCQRSSPRIRRMELLYSRHRFRIKEYRESPRYDPADILSKVCYRCGEDKPIFEFWRDSKNKDGYCTLCKECSKATQRVSRKKALMNVTY